MKFYILTEHEKKQEKQLAQHLVNVSAKLRGCNNSGYSDEEFEKDKVIQKTLIQSLAFLGNGDDYNYTIALDRLDSLGVKINY